jgi:hypothetical protein
MSRILISVFLICCAISCKKDRKQGTVEFDLEGTHYSFVPESIELIDLGNWQKLSISLPQQGQFHIVRIVIADYKDSMPGPNLLRPIPHYSGDSDTIRRTGFQFGYDDISGCQYDVDYDTANAASLDVISCSGQPPVLNATFQAVIQFGIGNSTCHQPKHFTNGKITNVTYPWP